MKTLSCQRRAARKWRTNCWEDWLFMFRRLYGKKPACQVCGRALQWEGHVEDIVHWDHKNGRNHVTRGPREWAREHACTRENVQQWVEFQFGILCRRCNSRLPTERRIEFLEKALVYAKGSENG